MSTFTPQFLDNLFSTGNAYTFTLTDIHNILETEGTGYWATSLTHDDEARTFTIGDYEGVKRTVSYDALTTAINKHAVTYFPYWYLREVASEIEAPTEHGVFGDSDMSDMLIQFATFDTLVYG